MEYDLQRFYLPQQQFYARALDEIKHGHKCSCWMWYIFPQLKGLGRSAKSCLYGINDLSEAKAYLADETLGSRLLEISSALLSLPTSDANLVMGSEVDAKKLFSSMTLFALAAPKEEIFTKVLEKFFYGKYDSNTITLLQGKTKSKCDKSME